MGCADIRNRDEVWGEEEVNEWVDIQGMTSCKLGLCLQKPPYTSTGSTPLAYLIPPIM